MSHLDILLPFALPPKQLATDLIGHLRAPALATLIARAKSRNKTFPNEILDEFSRALPHEIWLTRVFGLESALQTSGSPPLAPATMRSLGIHVDAGTWFILQPVYFHIARDHLVLTNPRHLMLSEPEAHALFAIAQPLFEEAGKTLIYGNANTWFVKADEWAGLRTSTPDSAVGHNIDLWLPKGTGERDWRKLQNEVQMHWFNHPLNMNREERGLNPVNSLWLWGAAPATLSAAPNGYSHVFNLSGGMQTFSQFTREHAHVDKADKLLLAAPHRGLLILDSLLEPALSNDWGRWLDEMHKLEQHWFAPLLTALKARTIQQISLILTSDTRIATFTSTRLSLLKFWRKPSFAAISS